MIGRVIYFLAAAIVLIALGVMFVAWLFASPVEQVQ